MAIDGCPSYLLEAMQETMQLSVFFENILTNHNLETVVAATLQSIQQRKDLTTMTLWYKQLEQRYNFSLSSVIFGTMASHDLYQLKTSVYGSLDTVNPCLNEECLEEMLGKTFRNKNAL